MKRITRLLIAAAVCATLTATDAFAIDRGRKDYKGGHSQPAQQHRPASRPGNNGHGSSGNKHDISRPSGNTGHQGNKPNHNNNHGHNKHDHNKQPGHIAPPSTRPGNNGNGPHHSSHHPSAGRPNDVHHPGPNRPHGVHHHAPKPPHRPYMPGGWSHWRPTPPPHAYRPYAKWPRFSTVLGIRFGTTLALTIDALLNTGYNVIANYNNTVYLRNVPMLGFNWPEASLSYTTGGRLAGSEFVTYSTWADLSLYNRLYGQLCASYGSPYTVSGTSAAWWGPDGQYIRLNFGSGLASDGLNRYYTTLNFGIY